MLGDSVEIGIHYLKTGVLIADALHPIKLTVALPQAADALSAAEHTGLDPQPGQGVNKYHSHEKIGTKDLSDARHREFNLKNKLILIIAT